MMDSYYGFRFRRWRRVSERRLVKSWRWLRRFIKKNIWRRTPRLRYVQRFLVSWFAVFGLMVGGLLWQFGQLERHYLVEQPAAGGSFVEGIVGEFGIFNPLFAGTAASQAANRLIFSGLTKSDGRGGIKPDLAEKWQVSQGGQVYTVTLRKGLQWHDGQPLTAADVVFTIGLIQNRDVGSSWRTVWEGVRVSALNDRQVKFVLPSPYAPFPHRLTLGLVPKHILSLARPDDVRFVQFNHQPVGSGPFRFDSFSSNQAELYLEPNEHYALGSPFLRRLVIKTYENYDQLLRAQRLREVDGVGGFDVRYVADFQNNVRNFHQWLWANQTQVFYNLRRAPLKDLRLRTALTQGADLHEIVWALENRVKMARSPLLADHLGYDSKLRQPGFNLARSKRLLDTAGWKPGADGLRAKNGKPLQLTMVAPNTEIYPELARLLQQQWSKLGITVDLKLEPLDSLQQDYIRERQFDLLLLDVALGHDSDVYAYWHSSQKDSPGLNFAGYQSAAVDEALEAGRTRLDDDIRAAKYQVFLKAWQKDLPGLVLFQPYYFYAERGLSGLGVRQVGDVTERFANAYQWAVNTKPVPKLSAE
ncbi:peptide ABC transporter substrate-binding protein [Candidatus Microgenomates bacterium]|nr:peptide ABC transporter substrate-binding protein [Candidatus Microgenomates bacterium]